MTDAEHSKIVAALLIDAGYEFVRDVQHDPGGFSMLVRTPNGSDDVEAVRSILTRAGYESSPKYPSWLPLRKQMLVSCVSPSN